MSAYGVFVHGGELIVVHGLDAAQQLANRLSASIASGEATGVIVKEVSGAALPTVEIYNELSFWQDVGSSLVVNDYNALTRDTLATMFGIIAGLVVLPTGPTNAATADIFASEIYRKAYDLITLGTQDSVQRLLAFLDRANVYGGVGNYVAYSLDNEIRSLYGLPLSRPTYSPETNTNFYNGTRSRPAPRDPLAIDLDGDGIETVGIVQGANPVLFDHDADGVRTGTGWLQGDDAWLVLDRDGNGQIDSGRELFGVDTLIAGTAGTASAVYARNGFEALRTLDANGDNLFNASDAAFAQVRLWRDLNQDGISQSNELSTLASQNITVIGLVPSTTVTNLGNGNTISGTATVTRSDGSNTTAAGVGVSTTAANLDLANNPFYRDFTTPVALTTLAQALPEMQGSGWVRDLREVACNDAVIRRVA